MDERILTDRLLLLRNTDDSPKMFLVIGEQPRKNRRCRPAGLFLRASFGEFGYGRTNEALRDCSCCYAAPTIFRLRLC